MFRTSTVVVAFVTLVLGTASRAQGPTPENSAATQPANKRNFRNFRPEDPASLKDRLTKELLLDASQQEVVAGILKEHFDRVKELRNTIMTQPEEGFARMRELTDELRTAREAGDTEKIQKLTDELKALGQEQQRRIAPMREALAKSNDKLRENLEEVLHEDQKEKFQRFWEDKMSRRTPYRGPERSPQTLKSLVERLPGLTNEQKQQIDQLFRQHAEAEKTITKGSSAERGLVNKLYEGVIGLLSPEQRAALEPKLAGRRPGARGPAGASAAVDQGGTTTQPADPQGAR